MENSDTNQLPEVDSLPDGFVDSSTEPLAPKPPTVEQDDSFVNYKEESLSEIDCANELPARQGGTEKIQKSRNFPVPLSESDSFDASIATAEVIYKGCVEVEQSGDPTQQIDAGFSKSVEPQSSERCSEEGSDAPVTHRKDLSSTKGAETLKNKKLEATETKRKNAKRTSKSEKEFLEFTLKYQQVLIERDGAISVRDKLESLCRELQRQNKMLMDECKRVSNEGQTLRLDLSAKFQDAIKDVSNKLEEQKDESLSQLKENEMLRIKLKQLTDQFALSEQQYAQKFKQKSLELQISELKIKQHEEKVIQEQSRIKLYEEQVLQLLATEKNLRLQLTADGEKFQQFQDALLKSNEVFETFKQEIEKMAKSIKELRKENVFLKSKCDKTDVTLIELLDERERLKKQLEKTKNQREKLESLCRSLQAERKQSSVATNSPDSVPV